MKENTAAKQNMVNVWQHVAVHFPPVRRAVPLGSGPVWLMHMLYLWSVLKTDVDVRDSTWRRTESNSFTLVVCPACISSKMFFLDFTLMKWKEQQKLKMLLSMWGYRWGLYMCFSWWSWQRLWAPQTLWMNDLSTLFVYVRESFFIHHT